MKGKRPLLLRPPFGAMNKQVVEYLKEREYSIVMWNNGNLDWFLEDENLTNIAIANAMPDSGNTLQNI